MGSDVFLIRYSQRAHTHTPMNTRTQTLPLWASFKTEPANLRDYEVITGASLSTGTSPPTECTTPLNPRIFAPIGSRTHDLMCYRGSCKLLCSCSMHVSLLCSCCMCFCALLHAFCAAACTCMLTAALQLHMQSLLSCFLSFFFL